MCTVHYYYLFPYFRVIGRERQNADCVPAAATAGDSQLGLLLTRYGIYGIYLRKIYAGLILRDFLLKLFPGSIRSPMVLPVVDY